MTEQGWTVGGAGQPEPDDVHLREAAGYHPFGARVLFRCVAVNTALRGLVAEGWFRPVTCGFI